MDLHENEKRELTKGNIIVGVDEVGRGAWINPLVFGVTVINNDG